MGVTEVCDDDEAAEMADMEMERGSAAGRLEEEEEEEEAGIGLSSSMLGSMPPLPFW